MKKLFGIVFAGFLTVSLIGCGASTEIETPDNPEPAPATGPGGAGGSDTGEMAPEAVVPPAQ